jgi:phospholipase C
MSLPRLLLLAAFAQAAAAACPGDCDGSGRVDDAEISQGVDAVLGRGAAPCAELESGGAGLTVRDLVRAASSAYRGCRLADCAFSAGALAQDTLEPGSPTGSAIPVDRIVWVMQENRSYDHYFGTLDHDGVDGLREGMANPDSDGNPVAPFHETDLCTSDVNHSWNGSRRQLNGGQMDGFVLTNEPGGERAMAHYGSSDLPFYHALATTFAMSDRHFCSLPGPTFPNRYFLYTGTAFGQVDNEVPFAGWTQRTILQEMTDRGLTWRVYGDVPFANVFRHVRFSGNTRTLQQFFNDAAAGTLPHLAIVDPRFTGVSSSPTDEHPPSNVQAGQAHVAAVVNALIAAPQWPQSALFWTYDEHGGYFDHACPPPACVPDATPPDLAPGDEPGEYDVFGFRVPLVVVSPWARPGYVSHRASDLTSVLRFLEARFGIPALTARDANALALLDLFDFTAPALLDPPALPAALVEDGRGCP